MRKKLDAFLAENNIANEDVTTLPLSGGERIYFRVIDNQSTYIAAYSEDIIENKTFFSFTKTLFSLELPVPELLAISLDNTMYLQQDLGKTCLLDKLMIDRYSESVYKLYEKSIEQLAKLNIVAHQKIDYTMCLASKQFDAKAALYDLHYCQKYYVDAMQIKYDSAFLEKEFLQLSAEIGNIVPHYFMYRDFQGRNIMVQDNQIYFIDYQGGMRGPLGYDVASLLWQAKAQLPADWKVKLLHHYIVVANQYLPKKINEQLFIANYYKILLMRLLQVLGAYGRRGLLEGKTHFIASIPNGINNIQDWMKIVDISHQYPTIHQLLINIVATKKI
jgi:aminoglycoside/choline kinase family phosphotransferase